jgi:hypothetical protein
MAGSSTAWRAAPAGGRGAIPIAADLLDAEGLRTALAGIRPSHIYFCSWMRMATEAENCRVNGAMVRNVFAALPAPGLIRHAALTTGLKHYLGPFEAYAQGGGVQTPFREEMPRLPIANFYYDQEDALFEAASRHGFSGRASSEHDHRPCRRQCDEYGLDSRRLCQPLSRDRAAVRIPGSPNQWHGLTDVRRAPTGSPPALGGHDRRRADQDFNIVNGDVFRWKWLWPDLATWFGIEAAPYPEAALSLDEMLAEDSRVWTTMAARHGLAEPDINRVASAWHTDADLGRPVECVTDMSKSRRAGSRTTSTPDSFFDLFARLRSERLIP